MSGVITISKLPVEFFSGTKTGYSFKKKGLFIKMRKLEIVITILAVIGIIVMSLLAGCSDQDDTRPKVVTSTSLIAHIVERVAGDKVDVVNIIPPAQCPGHFDCSPDDVKNLVDAELFLLHGWQGEVFSDDLIASANNEDLTVVRLNSKAGENMNWMAPPVQLVAIDDVTAALSRLDEANTAEYEANAEAYKAVVTAKGNEVKEKLAAINPGSIKVLCGQQQTGFLKWAGFNIIGMYGEPDTLTPQVVRDLVDTGNENNVTLVIDNMQSGIDAGAGIAEEINARQVTLSNFPGGYENTDTWEKTIDYNIGLLLELMKD